MVNTSLLNAFFFAVISLFFFLFGLQLVKKGLEVLALANVKLAITSFTATPWKGMLTGTIATFFVQSSSAVTIITISLVNSGLMNLKQAIGIVLGTNIGTCITVLFFTFDILNLYPLLASIGLVLIMLPSTKIRYLGVTILGFGAVFGSLIGLQYSLSPLQANPELMGWLQYMGKNHLSGIIAGTIFTAIIQSGSAVTGVVIALALQDLITLPGGIALILGSNIGTCITALIASITASSTGKKVAYFHVILNFFGVMIFYPFIDIFSSVVALLTPVLATQIAWAQIIFNVLSSLAALPFVNSFVAK